MALTFNIVICLYFVYQNVSRYLSDEIITQVQVLQEIPVIFPQVTICNFNPFVTEFSTKFLYEVGRNNSPYLNFSNDPRTIMLVSKAAAMNLSLDDRKKLGYTINQFFISCTFLTIDCDPREFISFYHFTYGNCFIFNSGMNTSGDRIDLKTVNSASLKGALSMELFVGNDLSEDASTGTGAVVFVSNHSERPIENSGHFLPASFLSSFQIDRVFNHRLGEPFSACKELGNNNLEEFKYSQTICIEMCFEDFFIRECGCYDPRYASKEKNKKCQSSNDFKCLQAASSEFSSCNFSFYSYILF